MEVFHDPNCSMQKAGAFAGNAVALVIYYVSGRFSSINGRMVPEPLSWAIFKTADKSLDAVLDEIEIAKTEIQIAMFMIGAGSIVELQNTDRLLKRSDA